MGEVEDVTSVSDEEMNEQGSGRGDGRNQQPRVHQVDGQGQDPKAGEGGGWTKEHILM